MKKKLLPILVILCSLSFKFAQAQALDINGQVINASAVAAGNSVLNESHFLLKSTSIWDSVRAVSELNIFGTDAYPYISPDGLRLYYTQGSGTDYLYYASRSISNFSEPFTNPQIVSAALPSGIRGCWFTNDELEIFYSDGFTLYTATRSSIGGVFSAPQTITLTGVSGFISAPSFSPNKQELFLYNQGTTDVTLRCVSTGPFSYEMVDTITVPPGYFSSTGQISKDGLSYYVPVDSLGSSKLHKLTRTALMTPFANLTLLSGNINNNSLLNFQPSVTANEDIIVFVKNNLNTWADNDMYLAHATSTLGVDLQGALVNPVKLSPNPAVDYTEFKFEKYPVQLRLFNVEGKVVFNEVIANGNYRLNTEGYESGLYMYAVIFENSKSNGKLIIK